jgi:hypothetical protein
LLVRSAPTLRRKRLSSNSSSSDTSYSYDM